MSYDKLQLPLYLSARADRLRAEVTTLREHLPPLADWFQRAEDLLGEVQATGLRNDEDEDMVPEKTQVLGMTEINYRYCDLVDGVRLAHNPHDA